ncbi:uncharacterized protein N7525_008421 [Penicillium rubens]|uniref:uncharacterized protein n=1 Tax=Penicillium rubens TaxID=1108849 RepID=UPI002A5AFBDC|nr:uncharacterized protein N7525_008421 [Penicillium rubens]KAJ5830168.1 hypothetical protein N7525_008421 [Penicillium rubens]
MPTIARRTGPKEENIWQPMPPLGLKRTLAEDMGRGCHTTTARSAGTKTRMGMATRATTGN